MKATIHSFTLIVFFGFFQEVNYNNLLIGTWYSIKAFKSGVEFKNKEVSEEYEMAFLENGKFALDLRVESDKKRMGVNSLPTPYVWKTYKNKLVIEVGKNHPLSGDSDEYLIFFKSDTLVLMKDEFIYFYLRK